MDYIAIAEKEITGLHPTIPTSYLLNSDYILLSGYKPNKHYLDMFTIIPYHFYLEIILIFLVYI